MVIIFCMCSCSHCMRRVGGGEEETIIPQIFKMYCFFREVKECIDFWWPSDSFSHRRSEIEFSVVIFRNAPGLHHQTL